MNKKKRQDRHAEAPEKQSGGFSELYQTALLTVIIAFVLRTVLFQPFTIPSSSMQPNLMTGDYIIASKYALGYGRYAASPIPIPIKHGRLFERAPKRGDVIVFRPEGVKTTYVKRLIGLPGDKISMQDGVLTINNQIPEMVQLKSGSYIDASGEPVTSEIWTESFQDYEAHIFDDIKNAPEDNMTVVTVPEGYYFMLGDNRDHSGDSRMRVEEGGVGLIPSENIIGRAEFVLFSVTPDFAIFKPWTWGNIRRDRFFKGL